MSRASVCFDYNGHCVEYGSELNSQNAPSDADDAAVLVNRVPFLRIDGLSIELTSELLHGWDNRAFGDAVHAYMARCYPLK